MSKQIVIYGICDSSGQARYVSKTNDVERRFKDHLSESERMYPLYNWLRKQLREGSEVTCRVLASAVGDWRQLERDVIAQYRADYQNMLNLADGGDEPYCSTEVRKIIGANIKCPVEVRQANGRKVSAAIQADPKRKRLHELKKFLCQEWSKGHLPVHVKDKLVNAGLANPSKLWCFVQAAAKHG